MQPRRPGNEKPLRGAEPRRDRRPIAPDMLPGVEGPASRFSLVVFILAVGVAAALRLPSLALRPMHADEAVHADKFGSLLEGRGYAYDRTEYHGPTLYYLTLLPAWITGARRYADLD